MTTIAAEKIVQITSQPLVGTLPGPVDDGSSSGLSDPDDRTGNEDGNDAQDVEEDGSDVYDTEAETERLEETPRTQRNVLLTPSVTTLVQHRGSRTGEEQREETPTETPQQASDSSPEVTGDEDKGHSTSLSSRKRKRPAPAPSQRETRDGGRKKSTKMHELSRSRSPSVNVSSSSPTPVADDQNHIELQTVQPVLKQSHKKGKRKGRKVKENDALGKDEGLVAVESPRDIADHVEAASSNEEDIEMEDAGERDGGDADNANKTEEDLAKKKIAMDSLSAIEVYFATYRDKLFDERLAQCNDELAMLDQPTFIHPELLLMKEVIDRLRDQKVQYEQTLLKYKLETLQRESIANKAQVHSQYMITAGEIRDTYLSQINAEIYQTQRERRNCEGDMPDFMYAFNPRRSKQIRDQTAYNEEISLLSGIAKYVGFPAAPDINQIRPNEWEEDQKSYRQNVATEDNSNSARRASQNHPPILRASLSAASNFSRPQPAAEDKFFQQNAWANPQHAAHQKHRQASVFSQAATPSATPANQNRIVEVHGSGSTIPEHDSAPISSILQTPATEEAGRDANTGVDLTASQVSVDATPSRVIEEESFMLAPSVENPTSTPRSEVGPGLIPFSSQTSGRDSQILETLPRAIPILQSGETAPASSPLRNPAIKAEDPGNVYGHSPVGQQNQGPSLVSAISNG